MTTKRLTGKMAIEAAERHAWRVVATIPQIDGGVREVLVRKRDAREVREALRDDPARIDGLWCETRTRDCGGK